MESSLCSLISTIQSAKRKSSSFIFALLAVGVSADIRVRAILPNQQSRPAELYLLRLQLSVQTTIKSLTHVYVITPQGLGSRLNCAYGETTDNNTAVEKWLKKYCQQKGSVTHTTKPLRTQCQNATCHIRDITAEDRYNSSTVTTVPVTYTEKAFRSSLEPIWAGYKNETCGIFVGAAMLGYWDSSLSLQLFTTY